MAKYCGIIGFVQQEETRPGIWEEVTTERRYYGDILKNLARHQTANQLNDDFQISDEISIIADPYARENFSSIKYIFQFFLFEYYLMILLFYYIILFRIYILIK